MSGLIDAIRVTTVGTQVATGAASADVALPSGATGARVQFYRFITVTGSAHVKIGPSGGTATVNDLLITTTERLLDCGGCTNFQHIQETATVNLQVSPVEGG